jgi:hypothetical protein
MNVLQALEDAKRAMEGSHNCLITDRPDLPRADDTCWTTDFSKEIKAIDEAIASLRRDAPPQGLFEISQDLQQAAKAFCNSRVWGKPGSLAAKQKLDVRIVVAERLRFWFEDEATEGRIHDSVYLGASDEVIEAVMNHFGLIPPTNDTPQER